MALTERTRPAMLKKRGCKNVNAAQGHCRFLLFPSGAVPGGTAAHTGPLPGGLTGRSVVKKKTSETPLDKRRKKAIMERTEMR